MFGRKPKTAATVAATLVADITDDVVELSGIERIGSVDPVAEARDAVDRELDRLTEEVRAQATREHVLVLREVIAELRARNANHPEDAYPEIFFDGLQLAVEAIEAS